MISPAPPFRAGLLVVLLVLAAFAVDAWTTATQKSSREGVTVAVTAGQLDPAAPVWDFALALHSKGPALGVGVMDDITLVANGHRVKPLAWEGEGATAARHRAGVLKFIAIRPLPAWIELHVQRKGEGAPRVFRWEFGHWEA